MMGIPEGAQRQQLRRNCSGGGLTGHLRGVFYRV